MAQLWYKNSFSSLGHMHGTCITRGDGTFMELTARTCLFRSLGTFDAVPHDPSEATLTWRAFSDPSKTAAWHNLKHLKGHA
eukprot:4569291-Karenia_brevis.AAC.1